MVGKRNLKGENEEVRITRRSPSRVTSATSTTSKSPTKVEIKSSIVINKKSSGPRSPGRTKRSPVRQKSRSPARKSPVRRNPPRSPARALPSRKSKSPKRPARKSPSRKVPTKKDDKDVVKKSVSKSSQEEIIINSSDSDSASEVGSEASKSSFINLLPRLRRTPSRENSVESVGIVRRSLHVREMERVVHRKNNYEPVAKLTEFSDEDEARIDHKVKKKPSAPSLRKIDLAGCLKALFNALAPIGFFFGILSICNDKDCSFKVPGPKDFAHIMSLVDLCVFTKYLGCLAGVAVISVLPIGGSKYIVTPSNSAKIEYRTNGLFTAFVALIAVIVMKAYNINALTYLLDNFYKFSFSAFILVFPLSVIIFIKSFFVPLSSLTDDSKQMSLFENFFYGRQVNPRFGKLDIKVILFRLSFLSFLMVTVATLCQNISFTSNKTLNATNIISDLVPEIKNVSVNWTVFVICIMFIMYGSDAFIFERGLLSTGVFQYESLGFIRCLEYCCFMSYYSVIPLFVYQHQIQLPLWQLGIAGVQFLIGYVFFRGSNAQKHAFRENPYSPAVAHLESIPTGSKKIICSGYWGIVRHPNYLGDILMNLGFLHFTGFSPPSIVVLLSIFGLIDRSHGDNKKCKQNYGTAWDRYCQRVPYALIPKVY